MACRFDSCPLRQMLNKDNEKVSVDIILQPSIKTVQSIMYFQFRFMAWTPADMEEQDDRYGSEPFGYITAKVDNQLIGVTNLLKRSIKFHNQNILLGGFGGVCVHKDFRRQGFALKMLQAGIKELNKQNCDVAFLCTDLDLLSSLYSQVGFLPLNRQYKATGESGKVYFDKGGMIALVKSKDIFDRVLADSATFDLQGQDW